MPENDLTASPKELPENAFDRLKKKLEVMGYGGVPLGQRFLEAEGTGANRTMRFGELPIQNNPVLGAKLQYNTDNPNLAFNLDVMRSNPNIAGGNKAFGGGMGFKQKMLTASPNIVLKYPNETDYEPYGGLGPAFIYSQQGDSSGWSPPSVDVGFNGFAGLKKKLNDDWNAFLEAKYQYGNITPYDDIGAIQGSHSAASLVGGIGYKFGGPKK